MKQALDRCAEIFYTGMAGRLERDCLPGRARLETERHLWWPPRRRARWRPTGLLAAGSGRQQRVTLAVINSTKLYTRPALPTDRQLALWTADQTPQTSHCPAETKRLQQQLDAWRGIRCPSVKKYLWPARHSWLVQLVARFQAAAELGCTSKSVSWPAYMAFYTSFAVLPPISFSNKPLSIARRSHRSVESRFAADSSCCCWSLT